MDKGYYSDYWYSVEETTLSQSTIKMDKGYYKSKTALIVPKFGVAIHNKNGQGLLPTIPERKQQSFSLSQSTIKMDKGYYNLTN